MDNTILNQQKTVLANSKAKWIYWSLTAPFIIAMFIAAIALLVGASYNLEALAHLGYPAYIAKILGTAKLLGVIAIVQNKWTTIKEWAYAGYTINLLGAFASHAFSGDAIGKLMAPLVILGLVLASYRQWKKLQNT